MWDNEYYIQEYIETRGLSKNTEYGLRRSLKHYCKYQQATIYELLKEADDDEEHRLRWKHRKLKQRLTSYMNYIKREMTLNSAKHYLKMVKSFYRHHEIEIGKLPPLNQVNANVIEPVTYNDLPNEEIIHRAYDIAEPLMRALLLFLSSSGMSKVDALNLTIQDYITATYKMHQSDNVVDAIKKMEQLNGTDLIPVWNNRRQKTNKYYITFNTPEATIEINNYLKTRLQKEPVTLTCKLFKVSPHRFSIKFAELNDALCLGKVGAFNRLRGHMLRKFHASNLKKSGLDTYTINVMQGKSNGAVDDVYFFADETRLRDNYIQHMQGLLILSEVNVVDVDSADVVKIRNENKLLLDRYNDLQKEVDLIKSWWQS